MYTCVLDTDVSDTCVSKDNTDSNNGNDVCTSHICIFMRIYIHHKMFCTCTCTHMYHIHTRITYTYAYNLRGSVMRVETTLIRIIIMMHARIISYVHIHVYICIIYTYAYNLRGPVMRVETTLIRVTIWCMYTECCIYSLLHLECHSIPISNLNLLGLFSTERGKSDLKN